MSVLNISQKANRELYRYDNVVNMDDFNTTEKWNDIWNGTHSDLCCDLDLPPVHLWEDGFCKGDASEEEINELIERFEVEDEDALYSYLDYEFESRISDKLDTLIEEYLAFFKKEKTTEDSDCSIEYLNKRFGYECYVDYDDPDYSGQFYGIYYDDSEGVKEFTGFIQLFSGVIKEQ